MTQITRRRAATAAGALGALSLACCLVLAGEPPATPQGAELMRARADGMEFAVYADGCAYRRRGEGWVLHERLFDPSAIAAAYVDVGGALHRRDPTSGQLIAMRRRYRTDFETGITLRELIGLAPGWTAFTLQSPRAREVPDYVALRREILAGRSGCLDNALELGPGRASAQGLRARAVAKASGMVCSKASLSSELLHAVKGDRVRFDGWFQLAEGVPFSLVDLESTWITGHPGIRVVIWGGEHLGMELKWADKPEFRQPQGGARPVPRGRWFRLRFELLLSEDEAGRVRLWQDETLLIDAPGRTLPLAAAIYNDLEVGISATDGAATVLLDDLAIDIDRP